MTESVAGWCGDARHIRCIPGDSCWPDGRDDPAFPAWHRLSSAQRVRPDWDTYFLDIALAISARGDCSRAQHGCILVKDRRIVSGGYNGSPSGDPRSCLAGDCPNSLKVRMGGDYQKCIALHAEQNAVAFANRLESLGATAYLAGRGKPGKNGSLHRPCDMCAKVLQAAGVVRVVCRADDGEVWTWHVTGDFNVQR